MDRKLFKGSLDNIVGEQKIISRASIHRQLLNTLKSRILNSQTTIDVRMRNRGSTSFIDRVRQQQSKEKKEVQRMGEEILTLAKRAEQYLSQAHCPVHQSRSQEQKELKPDAEEDIYTPIKTPKSPKKEAIRASLNKSTDFAAARKNKMLTVDQIFGSTLYVKKEKAVPKAKSTLLATSKEEGRNGGSVVRMSKTFHGGLKQSKRDYASNITMKYPSSNDIRGKTPHYYNRAGPADYNIPSIIGVHSNNNKYHNSPAYRIRLLNDVNKSVELNQTMLYPKVESIRSRSPVMCFPKQSKPADVFKGICTNSSLTQTPVMYQHETTTNSRKSASINREQRSFQRIVKPAPGPGDYNTDARIEHRSAATIFGKDLRASQKVYAHEYEKEMLCKEGPGPGRYDIQTSITPNFPFPRATRNLDSIDKKQQDSKKHVPGPGDYNTDLATWKRATSQISQVPKCVIPQAYRRFDIIKQYECKQRFVFTEYRRINQQ